MSTFSLTPLAWVFLGTLAIGTSWAAVKRAVDPRVAGLLSAALWFVWAFSSFRVVTVTETGTFVAHNWSGLGWLGFAIGVIMFIDWILLVVDEFEEDVRLT